MPIDRRSVVVDGRRVSYLTAGGSAAARAILLIHGSAVSAGYWINQLCSLGDAFQVAAIDLPGHGKSDPIPQASVEAYARSEEHTSELQSPCNLVCRLLLEKKKKK